jgi:molybdenum ABC transporter molybdate-binding protein
MLEIQISKKLRDFSVELNEQIGNETLVIIGHSGCGKSSTLKMLAGLVEPDEGYIGLEGQRFFDKKNKINLPPESRNIGFVFQNYALFPHLTVTENILFGIKDLSDEEKQLRLQEVLALLGLHSMAQAKPSMLSGGEQQRVAIARALVTRPKLLLFDEPLSALDVSTRTRVRTELKELLHTLSIPSIVVTHDYEDARILGDRIAVMDQGKIIQSGKAAEIAEYPASDFVAEFTGTNLLFAKQTSQYISVYPWHVVLSRTQPASNQVYFWEGKIRDMSMMGGFVRMNLEAASSLLADVSMEMMETEQFQTGETVYAFVPYERARIISNLLHHEKPLKKEVILQPKSVKRKKNWIIAVSAFVLLLAAVGLSNTLTSHAKASKDPLIAMIAANATEPVNDILKQKSISAKTTFAGTQILTTQMEQGAKADLFLSADLAHMQTLEKEGIVSKYQPVSHGHEVIVVPKGNPKDVKTIKDLADKQMKLIIGVDTVPIGKYTRIVFKNADAAYGNQFTKEAMSHVVSMESDVKQVLQKVAMGEADAGVVYRSDVTPKFKDKVEIINIPSSINAESTNYIAVPKNAPDPKAGEALMNFIQSQEGQAVFAKYGYDPLKKDEMK